VSKKQTRKSVSISRATYDVITQVAADEGIAVSELVTRALRLMIPTLPPQVHASLPPGDPVRFAQTPPRPRLFVSAATPVPPSEMPRNMKIEIAHAVAMRSRAGIADGTLCANCVDAKATHMGRIDLTDWRGPLCDGCELPSDCKEIARYR
jgi:hypothetical protein